jgi:hypothetical protein
MQFVGSMPNILKLSKCVLLPLFLEEKKKKIVAQKDMQTKERKVNE